MNCLKLRAQNLKKIYGVYGHFYDLQLNGTSYPCRSCLEIIAHDKTPLALNSIIELSPDILVVMMNPGSSHPVDGSYQPEVFQDLDSLVDNKEIVPTIPDNTQYQIMRVMAEMGWQHGRILNLSDLRNPKSTNFVSMVQTIGNGSGFAHSIFYPGRRQELERLLPKAGQKQIIAGWGRDPALLPLAEQCLAALPGYHFAGVALNPEKTLYAHPSPMLQTKKDAWLKDVIPLLT